MLFVILVTISRCDNEWVLLHHLSAIYIIVTLIYRALLKWLIEGIMALEVVTSLSILVRFLFSCVPVFISPVYFNILSLLKLVFAYLVSITGFRVVLFLFIADGRCLAVIFFFFYSIILPNNYCITRLLVLILLIHIVVHMNIAHLLGWYICPLLLICNTRSCWVQVLLIELFDSLETPEVTYHAFWGCTAAYIII